MLKTEASRESCLGAALVATNSRSPSNRSSKPDVKDNTPDVLGLSSMRLDQGMQLHAVQQEQLESYKQATEQFILERYYALESGIEHMLKKFIGANSNVGSASSHEQHAQFQDSDALARHIDRLLAHLDTVLKRVEGHGENVHTRLSEQIVYGIKSMEATLEREISKQCEMISNLSHSVQESYSEQESHVKLDPFKSTKLHHSSTAEDTALTLIDNGEEMRGANKAATFKDSNGTSPDVPVIPQLRQQTALSQATGSSQGPGFSSTLARQPQRSKGANKSLGKAVGLDAAEVKIKQRTSHDLFTTQSVHAKNALHACIQTVARSPFFIAIMELCILVNVTIKAVNLDIDVRRAINSQEPVSWGYLVDVIFTAIFTFEIVIRLIADQGQFFTGVHNGWNIFDLIVVVVSCFEVLTNGTSVGFLRIFRSVRLVRMLKVIRVLRFFRELRLMAVSIASCMVSLFWALVLIFLVVVCFAMFVLEGSKNYLLDTSNDDKEARKAVAVMFGSFPETVYSLIQTITGGGEWGTVAEPLLQVSWMYGIGFALFVSFVTLGMMNILIGIFVTNAQNYSQIDRDLVIQEEMDHRESYMNQLRELFYEMDEDGSGTITYEEFNETLSHERAKAYLDFLELEATEAQGLFMLLDLDENGEVGVEEFVFGCMRLKGTAKSIDAASMMFQTKRLAMKVNELYAYTREHFEMIADHIHMTKQSSI